MSETNGSGQISMRSALERERASGELARLRADNAALRETIVGLSSLVARAHVAGFIGAATPMPPDDESTPTTRREARLARDSDAGSDALNGGRAFTR